MATRIRVVEYYYLTARDQPGQGYRMLSELASQGVNLLAMNAVPLGPETVEFSLFPEDAGVLVRAAGKVGLPLTGPQRAFLVQGDDQLGALAEVHRRLYDAGVNVYASGGVTDGRGGYGCIVYVKPESLATAARVLDAD